MNIGEIIEKYIKENGMSQRSFAKAAGMSTGYISMLVSGKNTHSDKPIAPTLSTLIGIAAAMGVTLDDLLEQADDINIDISKARRATATAAPAAAEITAEELALLALFRRATPENRYRIVQTVMDLVDSQESAHEMPDLNAERVLVYRAAHSREKRESEIKEISTADLERLRRAKPVTSEDEL